MNNAWQHDPIWFAPTRKLGGGWIAHKDAPSPAAAPDYTGAAQATAAGNIDAARAATAANRVDTYTPYGNLTYTNYAYNGNPDKWSSSIELSPTGQRLLDTQNQTSLGLGSSINSALDNTRNAMGRPFDPSQVGPIQTSAGVSPNYVTSAQMDPEARQHAEQAAYAAATSRLDPQWNQREQMQQTQLRNQGLVPGGEAYTNAMRDFNFGRNDAYSQAQNNAVQQGLANQQSQFGMNLQNANLGNQVGTQQFQQGLANANLANSASQQQLQQQAYLRSLPLNELNALRTGAQVTNPQFQNAPQQQTTPGANFSGAANSSGQYAQGLYNAGVGQANAFNSGLFSLGAAGIGML